MSDTPASGLRPSAGKAGFLRKALVIGAGAREHAIGARLAEEGWDVSCAPGNVGIARHLRCVPLAIADVPAAVALARKERPELVVVGPEELDAASKKNVDFRAAGD